MKLQNSENCLAISQKKSTFFMVTPSMEKVQDEQRTGF